MGNKYENFWDKGSDLHTDNPKAALISYFKALDGLEHPLLYADIADCYFRLGDNEGCEKYYNLAEENGFLDEREKDTESKYNDYAWFLYSFKKDYEKAFKVIQISLQLGPKEDYITDTYIHIFLMVNKDEAIKELAQIYKKNQKFEFSTKLFDIYKNEINTILKK
ncbi:hypothetical protein JXR93_07580 [bacterium]|nr:hypothetical protein [bacterium]